MFDVKITHEGREYDFMDRSIQMARQTIHFFLRDELLFEEEELQEFLDALPAVGQYTKNETTISIKEH